MNATVPVPVPATPGIVSSKPLRGTRRTIARRLTEIWQSGVPVTLHAELELVLADGRPLGDMIALATIEALRRHPALNAHFDGETHTVFSDIHLGIAVDTPKGLLVPVVRDAHALAPAAFAGERRAVIERARGGRQAPEELTGGTFTLSSLGSFGIDHFTPIINPPQVAILGTGRIRTADIAWGRESEPRRRTLLPASLTFDHRVCDGADAARFLQTLQAILLQGDGRE